MTIFVYWFWFGHLSLLFGLLGINYLPLVVCPSFWIVTGTGINSCCSTKLVGTGATVSNGTGIMELSTGVSCTCTCGASGTGMTEYIEKT